MGNWAAIERWSALCIAGPTASGKTALALEIAQQIPCEIISVDSALVYRCMDIGTAKPSRQELALCPHHLIDIIEPTQSYSAAQFASDARRLMGEIQSHGRLPLLVGGTMLYFRALLQGMDEMPQANAQIRAEIDAEAKIQGWPAMHAQLAQVDPITAARLAPNDAQRIQRALEVHRASGLPLSHFHRISNAKSAKNAADIAWNAPDSIANSRPIPIISLEPRSRAWLHERIARRWDAMMNAGLIEEVRRLRERGDLSSELPAMRCVGYRQIWEMLDGAWPETELRERALAATRQLAKRQITWQRSMQAPAYDKHVIAPDEPDFTAQALRLLQSWR